MHRKLTSVVWGLVLSCFLVLPVANVVLGDPAGPSPGYLRVMKVVKSPELSQDQKIDALKKLAGVKETQMIALYQMELLDRPKTFGAAAEIFRAQKASRLTKLSMGHYLLSGRRPGKKGFPKGFVKEFADYLVGQIVSGGEKEFCAKLPERTMTAVGEYAYLASHFDGYKAVDFRFFKDKRVVPVLIACLNAPDNVYCANQGCCVRGKPGEPTGRNTARQQIPIALAHLGDKRAVSPLRWILDRHYDWHERNNAAYTLAVLMPKGDRAKLITDMKARKFTRNGRLDEAKDRYRHLYAFGRGLLARGDDAGVEFMAFKYSIYDGELGLSENAYMLAQRLADLKGVKSAKLEGFFKQAFATKPVMGMLLMDETRVKINDYGHTSYDLVKAAPRIEGMFDSICKLIEANKLVSLRATIGEIGKGTKSQAIRGRAKECAAALRPERPVR